MSLVQHAGFNSSQGLLSIFEVFVVLAPKIIGLKCAHSAEGGVAKMSKGFSLSRYTCLVQRV